jgi:hypothetical protein
MDDLEAEQGEVGGQRPDIGPVLGVEAIETELLALAVKMFRHLGKDL